MKRVDLQRILDEVDPDLYPDIEFEFDSGQAKYDYVGHKTCALTGRGRLVIKIDNKKRIL